jgi:hypothetical protein
MDKNETNYNQFTGKVVIMRRGISPFTTKARIAQQNSAIALIVYQTDEQWPYVMSDKANVGKDIRIPTFLISSRDFQRLQPLLNTEITSSSSSSTTVLRPDTASPETKNSLNISIFTRHRHLTCTICCDDLELDSIVVQLPCLHYFHPECLQPWLERKNVCPTCRYTLPSDNKAEKDKQRREAEHKELHANMFT